MVNLDGKILLERREEQLTAVKEDTLSSEAQPCSWVNLSQVSQKSVLSQDPWAHHIFSCVSVSLESCCRHGHLLPGQLLWLRQSRRNLSLGLTASYPETSLPPRPCMDVAGSGVCSEIERTLSKSAGDTKLSGAVDSPGEGNATQRDLDRLEEWAHVNVMKFNKAKCKVLHMGWSNPWYQYRLEDEWIESSPVEKDLAVPVVDILYMTWQQAPAAQKANRVLGCVSSSVSSRLPREAVAAPGSLAVFKARLDGALGKLG
ncbi:cAMP-dependent protein kinase inhibitor alpha [Grus japonensis]|uniref:cAMP-dependent protein kinase inhibitor alpha n=1 Tax=Grus japonensis TaxID=30415 RepID=A0ABC9XTN0_GRUJA